MSAPLTDSGQGMAPGRGWLRLPTQLRIAGQEVPLPPLSSLAVPMLAVVVLAMMLLPLPAPVLDFLFTFNIASSLLVLLVAVYTVKALDFAVFPTVLLVTTLMRLSLSVASTRAVLLHGHTGTDAAGKVIEAFANFYRDAAAIVRAHRAGRPVDPALEARVPDVVAGARGVRFVSAAVASNRTGGAWTKVEG